MDKKLFAELVESMTQMNEIARGERAPSREFHVDAFSIKELRSKIGLSQPKFAAIDAHRRAIGFEIQQMTPSIADIISSLADAFAPRVVIEFFELNITASETHSLAVDAWKIGFAAESYVKRNSEHCGFHGFGRITRETGVTIDAVNR